MTASPHFVESDTTSMSDTNKDLEKGDNLGNQDIGTDDTAIRPTHQTNLAHLDAEKAENDSSQGVNANDWDGPNDPDNPYNWPMWRRIYQSIVPGFFGFAVTFGTSVYTPALPDIMKEFNVSRTAALTGLTVYVLGLAFGPVLSAPLSETHGRRIVYLTSIPLFMLFILGAGFSQSFASLVICRFFAGLLGAPTLAVGGGTGADIWPPHNRAAITSIFLAAPFLGPSLGPIIGGFAAQYKGWRWTQWSILFITLPIFITALPNKESYKPVILRRRAASHSTPLTRPPTASSQAAAVKRALMIGLFRPVHMLFTEPVVFFLSLYTAFAFGVLFCFFAAFPYVFQRAPYSFSTSQSGLAFVAIGTGVLVASVSGVLFDHFFYQKQHALAVAAGKSNTAPEHRLHGMKWGAFGIPVGLFWFAWTAESGVHWAVPIVAAVPFAWGNLSLFTSAALYMVDVYGAQNGASSLAANGIFRYTLGAVFPLFTVQMYEAMGIGWATSLLGFVSLAMLPIPFVFFRYGPRIRARSKYPVFMK
ncbi:MFS general substrate transporter [Polyplosphaeria fusca]|uniref:MFS general substrate transporter n=1 Tax=Polyplosphaeria fusca TaxID=682080 RepID=A0A9P4V2J3_9PLEO|nr:MFS general substrate transporter [Polyplosphaeria fusca]